MTPRDQGFLLLTSTLGDPARKPLTIPQFRTLSQRVKHMERPQEERELQEKDLVALGYDRNTAIRILTLLSHQAQLHWYLQKGKQQDCYPLTRLNDNYPSLLRQRLQEDAPGSLWVKGDLSLLYEPAVSLVGSRELQEDNLAFAQEVGRQAALQGYVLVSGNARGADKAAQTSCLAHGGKVICVVADNLGRQPLQENTLYLSEDGFDSSFSAHRALQRNRIIHCLGEKVFVAQCTLEHGGTWSGTLQNLRHSWSSVFCYQDGSPAAKELEQRGAELVDILDLSDFSKLQTVTPFL